MQNYQHQKLVCEPRCTSFKSSMRCFKDKMRLGLRFYQEYSPGNSKLEKYSPRFIISCRSHNSIEWNHFKVGEVYWIQIKNSKVELLINIGLNGFLGINIYISRLLALPTDKEKTAIWFPAGKYEPRKFNNMSFKLSNYNVQKYSLHILFELFALFWLIFCISFIFDMSPECCSLENSK